MGTEHRIKTSFSVQLKNWMFGIVMGVPWQCVRLFCLYYSQNFWVFVVVRFRSLVVGRRFASPLKILEAICNWIECTHAHATPYFGSFKWDISVLMKMFYNSKKWSMLRCRNDHQFKIINKLSTICGSFFEWISYGWAELERVQNICMDDFLVNLQTLE